MKSVDGRSFALLVTLCVAMFASSAQAQDQNTYIYIAHAASGRGMSSTTNPAMPLDVSVDGNCITKGISFGEIRGPFSGPAGSYTFNFTTANSAAPCSGPVVFSAAGVGLNAATTYFGVVALNASNAVTGLLYTANLNPVPTGQASVQVINTTDQFLTATITNTTGVPASLGLPASSLQISTVLVGVYQDKITDSAGNIVAGPGISEFAQQDSYLYILAGASAANNSVQLIGPKVIRGVF
jgi:hypothetical protein